MNRADRDTGLTAFGDVIGGLAAVLAYVIAGTLFVMLTRSVVFGSVLGDLVCLAGSAAVYYGLLPRGRDGIRRYQPADRDLLPMILAATPVFWFLTECMAMYIMLNVYDPGMDSYQAAAGLDAVSYIILTLIAAPLAEEYLMRGAVYGLLRRAMSWPAAAAVSAVLFGAIHGTVAHFYFGFMFGMLACAACEYTGTIRYAVLMHFMCNLLSFLMGYVPVPEFMYMNAAWVVLTNIACIGFVMLLFMKITRMKSDEEEFQATLLRAEPGAVILTERAVPVEQLRAVMSGDGTLSVQGRDNNFIRIGSGVLIDSGDGIVLECMGCPPDGSPGRPLQFYDVLSVLSDRLHIVVLDNVDDVRYQGTCLGAKMGAQGLFGSAVTSVLPAVGPVCGQDELEHVIVRLGKGA